MGEEEVGQAPRRRRDGLAPALRVGLVGANWGLTHVDAWRNVPGVEVAAICTAHRGSAERAAEAHGIGQAFWDAEDMLADDTIEVIDVTIRPTARVPIAMSALKRGRHLLQPLPFALSREQAAQLAALASTSGRVAMIESLHRYAPAFGQMKALLEDGAIGRVHSVRAHVRTGILLSPPPGYVYGWITDPEQGASALRNFGAHLIHCLVWLFGRAEAVVARTEMRLPVISFTDGSQAPNGTADSADLLLRFANGANGQLDVSWCTPGSEGFGIDAIGSDGRLRLSANGLGPQNAKLEIAARTDADLSACPIDSRFFHVPGAPNIRMDPANQRLFALSAMCHAMAQAIRDEAVAVQPDFSEALVVMDIVENAYRSSDEGRWVEIADPTDAV